MLNSVMSSVHAFLSFASFLFVFVIGLAVLGIGVVYVADRLQTSDAIRRNYPVVGHLRSFFGQLGVFFRQYFFAMDREERPFNRAQRDWVNRAARNTDNTVPFGSTNDLKPVGTVFFVNCQFPTLDEDSVSSPPITIGETCPIPYSTDKIFHISAMSYGALSKVAIEALSMGASVSGCWLNTGEGGLSEYHLKAACDIVFQIGTAKYGVRNADGSLSDSRLADIAGIPQVRMFEVKLSQGAKPGKGGILPAEKVTKEIARIRGIPPGEASISPNRHPEINGVGELLDSIAHVRLLTGKPVGFKTVIGAYGWLDSLFEEINVRGVESAPDFITVDSADGGTGAAPMSLMDHVGLPISESLPIVVDRLIEYDLRRRVRIIASGKLVTPADVAWALCVGADFVTSARGFMFSLGCIQSLKCNRNSCPTGITTHNPRLQRGLDPGSKSAMVANYAMAIEREVGVIAHSCGVLNPRQLQRIHARVVTSSGKSIGLNEIY
jgi:glutamate synthase domain-containing protein 2